MGDLSERMSEQTSYGPDSYKGETPLGAVVKPTLDEMRLCVAKMLPEHIKIIDGWGLQIGKSFFFWIDKDRSREVTDREWLHVAWLAVQALQGDDRSLYCDFLSTYVDASTARFAGDLRWMHEWHGHVATVEHRLEALCRVKHPEMFTK